MRINRVYHPSPISLGAPLALTSTASHHLTGVLRMKVGQIIHVFDGSGYEYTATIIEQTKKHVTVHINEQHARNAESPLSIHLGQGISRGEKMDFTIQKAVELGVTEITPLFTERCGVKLMGERLEKRQQHWQHVAISACEQSGRTIIPTVHPAIKLTDWLKKDTKALQLTLHPRATDTIKTLTHPQHGIRFLVGPEGGLSDEEIQHTVDSQFKEIQLGPRILRTETAALTVLSALQLQFGDLA